MTHDKAVQTIARLGPQLNAGNPEDVLIKYASDQDLSVAQLEKLAQVYNTLAQVSHMKRADEAGGDRGSSCYLIKQADIISRFVEGDPEKAAAVRILEVTDDVERIDLNQELMDMAFPKAASTSAELTPAITPVPSHSTKEEDDGSITVGGEDLAKVAEAVRVAYWEARTDFHLAAEKLVKYARTVANGSRFFDLANDEEDAMHMRHPVLVKVAMDRFSAIALQAKPMKVVERFDGELKKRAFVHTSGASDLICNLTDAFVEMLTMKKFAGEKAFTIDEGEPQAAKSEEAAPAASPDAEGLDPERDAELIALLNSEVAKAPAAGASSVPKPSAPSPSGGGGGPTGGGGGGGGGKAGVGAAAGTGTKSWLASLIGALSAPVDAAGNAAAGLAEGADSALQRVTSKEKTNKPQRSADLSVADIKRSIRLRRMMATDPVLRSADPAMVLNLYNTIAAANPAAAQDPEAMRLALREAVSYEGVTPDTLKTMGDIRHTSDRAENQEADNSKRRYAIPS